VTHSFLMRFRVLLAGLRDTIGVRDADRIELIVNHGEPGDALVELAWLIVNRDIRIDRSQYDTIMELVDGFPDRQFFPESLELQVS
jgi:hypothetical protein